ncbi:MAG: DUF4260 domain-containing protein [Terracidiphilus sp.]
MALPLFLFGRNVPEAERLHPDSTLRHPMGMTPALTNADPVNSQACPAVGTPVVILLRLEGLAAAVFAAVLYARTGASWWLFAALWLVPDLSMLGYLLNPNIGARIYNAIHSYVTPATLAVCSMLLGSASVMPIALIWVNHIGVDRLLGYGLKYPAGFGWTHLRRMGKRDAEATQAS